MHRFKELRVWQKSMDIAVEVYKLTEHFPIEEKYGLTSQSRRSAISVPSNIAEGAGRRTNPEFRNFLNISNGSSAELETQLILAERLSFVSTEQIKPVLEELEQLQNMNFALMKSLDKS
jgi:four helix bundle protein